MKRVLSGIQPTGNLHLGNYLGAIKNWVDRQNDFENLFCIVDLHAITVPQNPDDLRNASRMTAAAYIACGIDPEKSAIFIQSAIAEHSELAWILGCHTPLGWLNRMTQFKDKAGKHKDQACLGLYGYPVLMAADILLYQATHVPVGEDQKQHLELARDIAGAFNRFYNKEFFTIPEPLITGEGTRVMSLRNGTKKMSKSDESEYSRVSLNDDKDAIIKKFKKAKSDSVEGISYDPENRPEASNLIRIYAAISGQSKDEVVKKYENSGFALFKSDIAELVADHMSPISTKINELCNDKSYLDSVLKKGEEKAKEIACKNISEVKKLVGFL